jgi:hypothetical protein
VLMMTRPRAALWAIRSSGSSRRVAPSSRRSDRGTDHLARHPPSTTR